MGGNQIDFRLEGRDCVLLLEDGQLLFLQLLVRNILVGVEKAVAFEILLVERQHLVENGLLGGEILLLDVKLFHVRLNFGAFGLRLVDGEAVFRIVDFCDQVAFVEELAVLQVGIKLDDLAGNLRDGGPCLVRLRLAKSVDDRAEGNLDGLDGGHFLDGFLRRFPHRPWAGLDDDNGGGNDGNEDDDG